MATVLDKATFYVVESAEIVGTIPNAWTWYLCGSGFVLSGFDPYIMQLGDFVKDGSTSVRTSLTIRRNAPHRITDNGTAKNFAGLAKVLQRYTVTNAAITMKLRAWTDAGDSHTATMVVGRIVKLANIGASSATLEVELRAEVQNALVPTRPVERGASWTDDEIPEESIGQVVPVGLGAFQIAKRSLYQTQTADFMRSTLPLLGFRPVVAPAVEVNRKASSSAVSTGVFAFQERLTGGLYIGNPLDTTNIGTPTAYIYESTAESYAKVWPSGSNAVFDSQTVPYGGMAWTAAIPSVTWCQVPIVPKKVLSAGAFMLDPQRAIDRNPHTYARMLPGAQMYIEVPQVALPWRISSNSTLAGTGTYDFEGAGVPPGIGFYILVVNPANEALGAGTVRMEIVWPRTDNTLFSVYTDVSYTSTPWAAVLGRLFLPYTQTGTFGAAGDGWGGTKFHAYRFTSHPNNRATDADYPLYASGANDKKDEPFRIKVWHQSGGPCYIAGVAMVLGVHHNVEAYTPDRRKTSGGPDVTGRNGKRPVYTIDSYADVELRTYDLNPGARLAIEAAGIQIAHNAISHLAREKRSVANAYVSAAGLIDDGSGTYTGTASSQLENPADLARYVLAAHGAQTSFVTGSGQAGSFVDARNNLNTWAGYNGVSKWAESLVVGEQVSVNQALATITGEAPGLVVDRKADGTWKASVWIADAAKFANDIYSATPLDVREIALFNAEGPDLDISQDDAARVVNSVTVDYSWDPARGTFRYRAKCDRNYSDDGQGGTWPVAPGGAAATAIAAWSYGMHTLRKAGVQAHGIHDGRLAAMLGCYVLWRNYRQAVRLRMRCGPALYALEVGQIFRLSNASLTAFGWEADFWGPSINWDAIYWEVTHVEAQKDRNGVSIVVQAEWRPTSIGGEVAGFAPGEEEGAM